MLVSAAASVGLALLVAVLASGAMGAFAPRTNVSTVGVSETTVTAPVGYYAFRANVGSYVFHNNSWDQGMSNDPPVSATGCGNTVSSGSFAMPATLLQHC